MAGDSNDSRVLHNVLVGNVRGVDVAKGTVTSSDLDGSLVSSDAGAGNVLSQNAITSNRRD